MSAIRIGLAMTCALLASSCGEEKQNGRRFRIGALVIPAMLMGRGLPRRSAPSASTLSRTPGSRCAIHATGTEQDCALAALSGTPEGFAISTAPSTSRSSTYMPGGSSSESRYPRGSALTSSTGGISTRRGRSASVRQSSRYTVDGGSIRDEINSIHGEPFCRYDYRVPGDDAPNCCLGTYVLEVTDAASGQVSTSPPRAWGGKASDCYGGAAFLWPQAHFDEDGWPLAYYCHLNYAARTERFEWPDVSWPFSTNVPLASYYDPADHEGGKPAGLAGARAGLAGAWAVEHYNLICAG